MSHSQHTQGTHGTNAGPVHPAVANGEGNRAATHGVSSEEAIPGQSHYITREAKYFFKAKEKDGPRRDTVILQVPALTPAGLVNALHDTKQMEYILDIINGEISQAAREQVNDTAKPVNKQEELDMSKLSIEFLANEPAGDRRGRGIPKEVWEDFAADYMAIMPELIGKSKESVANAVKLFAGRLQGCKNSKPVLGVLEKYLQVWFSNTENAEAFGEVYAFLNSKIETFLKITDDQLLENL